MFVRPDERPPGGLFVLGVHPFRTARHQDEHALREEQNFLVRHTNSLENFLERYDPILWSLRDAGCEDNGLLSRARNVDARRFHEVVKYAGIPCVRNALHGVGQVPIKSGEKAEAMLSRQVLAPIFSRAGNGDASRFAAEYFPALVNRHGEPGLDEFVRRAQSSHAPAENRYRLRHGQLLYL